MAPNNDAPTAGLAGILTADKAYRPAAAYEERCLDCEIHPCQCADVGDR